MRLGEGENVVICSCWANKGAVGLSCMLCTVPEGQCPGIMRRDPGGIWGGLLGRVTLLMDFFLLSGAGEI